METDLHPSEIGNFARYRRAGSIARSTSRLKNPDWYRDAIELDVQLHIYYEEETSIRCYLYQKTTNTYEKVDDLSQHQIEKSEEISNYIDEILGREDLKKAKSLGVILHLADELSLAGLGPEHQNPTALVELRERLSVNPTEILEDKTISGETRSWGLFPYPGAVAGTEFATAVAVSRNPAEFLSKVRALSEIRNFPIRTAAVCAPLCAISSLPWFLKENPHGTIAVLNYSKFTLLAICDKQCELLMLRYMPHANGKSEPNNIGAAALASASAFELEEPEINIISFAGNDVDSLIVSMQTSLPVSEVMLVKTMEFLEEKNLPSDVPVEILALTQPIEGESYPLTDNNTFRTLREDSWHIQDFLGPSYEELEQYPSENDMKVLKTGRMVKKIAALIMIGVIGYSAYNMWSRVNHEAWSYKKTNTQAAAQALHAELAAYEKWDNLLKDRSKAWANMELITQLSPTDGSVLMKDVKHRVSQKPTSGTEKFGFTKEWVIVGQANDKGIAWLGEMSTRDGIKDVFRKVAQTTENEAYIPDAGERDVTVNLKQDVNPRRAGAAEGEYMPYTFRMTIRQSFGSKDTLALSGAKHKNK